MTLRARPPITIGVSLKMYFGYGQTLEWADAVVRLAQRHPAIMEGLAELFIARGFVSLARVDGILAGSGVRLAAQDMASAASGPFTGEVSARELAELGVDLVEIGHAERRGLFHEDDGEIAAKVATAMRHGLEPLLCVGELQQAPPSLAGLEAVEQLDLGLAAARSAGLDGRVLVAYEPVWAIGQPEPAPAEHIVAVTAALEHYLTASPHSGSRVIYGGSAGPGLLGELGGAVKGLFLGRFAHDPRRLEAILDESLTVAAGGLPVAEAAPGKA